VTWRKIAQSRGRCGMGCHGTKKSNPFTPQADNQEKPGRGQNSSKKMGPSPRCVSVSSVDGTPLDLSGMAVERPSVVDGITREAEWMRTTIRSRRNHGHHPPWETSNHPMKERHLCLEVLALHAVLVLDGELPALRLGTRRAWESRAGTGEQLLWGPDQWDTRDRRIPIQKKDIHHTARLMSIVMVIPYAPPSG